MSHDLHDFPPAPLALVATCEVHEIATSALLDGELPAVEVLDLVDHLVACPACARFYRQCRAVDGTALAAEASEVATPSPELWERIAAAAPAASGAVAASRRRGFGAAFRTARGSFGGTRGWALRAAAVLAAAAIALFALRGSDEPGTSQLAGGRPSLEVELASDAGAMSDHRFVALTAELLRSDPRYHRKMLEVLELVTTVGGDEGSVDDRVIRGALATDRAGEPGDAESPPEPGDWRV